MSINFLEKESAQEISLLEESYYDDLEISATSQISDNEIVVLLSNENYIGIIDRK